LLDQRSNHDDDDDDNDGGGGGGGVGSKGVPPPSGAAAVLVLMVTGEAVRCGGSGPVPISGPSVPACPGAGGAGRCLDDGCAPHTSTRSATSLLMKTWHIRGSSTPQRRRQDRGEKGGFAWELRGRRFTSR